MNKQLTPKQEAFCREFVIDFNATRAYARAGYSPGGAHKLSSRLMAKDGIKARIAQLTEEAAKRNRLTVDDIIKVWKDAVDDPECRVGDRLIAARDAAKHLGMFIDKVEHEHSGNISFVMEEQK